MQKETWKPVNGYEGLYEVSDQGRVRSLDHFDGINHFHPGKILNAQKDKRYRMVHLSKKGKVERVLVHRLVATAFVEKPERCDIVNHLDNDPRNNNAKNLEWTTFKGNMQWATKQGRMHYQPENIKKAQESHKIPVIAIDKEGNRLWFPSQRDAVDALGLTDAQRRHIAATCRQERGYKTTGGYRWEYAM